MTETKEKELKVEDIRKSAEEKVCPVQRSLYYITEFLAGPMCGRCFPCEMGSYEARIRLQNIVDGRGTESDLRALTAIAEEMAIASLCKKGKDTAAFIKEWMRAGAFEAHVSGACASGECLALIEYRILPGECTMCALCRDACKFGAVLGEKRKPYRSGYLPYEIRQRRCTKCGECMRACPEGAIIVIERKQAEVKA